MAVLLRSAPDGRGPPSSRGFDRIGLPSRPIWRTGAAPRKVRGQKTSRDVAQTGAPKSQICSPLVRAVLIVNPNATSTTPAGRDLLAHALESRLKLDVVHTDHRGHAIEQDIDRRPPLEPRERRAWTNVRAAPKGEVVGGVLAVQAKRTGIGINRLVPIC